MLPADFDRVVSEVEFVLGAHVLAEDQRELILGEWQGDMQYLTNRVTSGRFVVDYMSGMHHTANRGGPGRFVRN